MPKIIKVDGNLTKFWRKQFWVFFETRCICNNRSVTKRSPNGRHPVKEKEAWVLDRFIMPKTKNCWRRYKGDWRDCFRNWGARITMADLRYLNLMDPRVSKKGKTEKTSLRFTKWIKATQIGRWRIICKGFKNQGYYGTMALGAEKIYKTTARKRQLTNVIW